MFTGEEFETVKKRYTEWQQSLRYYYSGAIPQRWTRNCCVVGMLMRHRGIFDQPFPTLQETQAFFLTENPGLSQDRVLMLARRTLHLNDNRAVGKAWDCVRKALVAKDSLHIKDFESAVVSPLQKEEGYMLSFHNDPAIKQKYTARLAAHAEADEIIQGQYWEEGKGRNK